jgi:hypothetical protein
MATIKLKDGNVILKGGKVSCTCCGGCTIEGNNIFEITEEEYDKFLLEGNSWQINYSHRIENSTPGTSDYGVVQGSVNAQVFLPKREGGSLYGMQTISGAGTWSGVRGGNNFFFNIQVSVIFGYCFGIIDGKYKVKFYASAGNFGFADNIFATENPRFPPSSQPMTLSTIANGNTLTNIYVYFGAGNDGGFSNFNATIIAPPPL